MSDLGMMKARVGAATRRIIEASTARRSQNQSLMQNLTELEAQFRSDERELLQETLIALRADLDRRAAARGF